MSVKQNADEIALEFLALFDRAQAEGLPSQRALLSPETIAEIVSAKVMDKMDTAVGLVNVPACIINHLIARQEHPQIMLAALYEYNKVIIATLVLETSIEVIPASEPRGNILEESFKNLDFAMPTNQMDGL